MMTDKVHGLDILLPDLDPDDLEEVLTPGVGDTVTESLIQSDTWARVRLSDMTVRRSRFDAATLTEAVIDGCRFQGNEFHRADLTGARVEKTTFERCAFVGCRLSAATFTAVTFKDVIFRECRMDFVRFDQARATGPLGIKGSILTEATFAGSTLSTFAVDDCRLAGLELDQCDLRGADLRHNDLSDTRGVFSLRGATLDDSQLAGLTVALVRDLELTTLKSRDGRVGSA